MPLDEFKGKIEKTLNEFGQSSADKIADALSKIYKEGMQVPYHEGVKAWHAAR